MITPALIKIVVIFLFGLGLFSGGWYMGSLRGTAKVSAIMASAADNERKASDTALQKDASYDKQLAQANEEHAAQLRALADRLPNTDPIFVRRTASPVCPSAVSGHTGTPSATAAAGPVESRIGDRDIRPAVESFKERWEAVMTDCRLLQNSWPK